MTKEKGAKKTRKRKVYENSQLSRRTGVGQLHGYTIYVRMVSTASPTIRYGLAVRTLRVPSAAATIALRKGTGTEVQRASRAAAQLIGLQIRWVGYFLQEFNASRLFHFDEVPDVGIPTFSEKAVTQLPSFLSLDRYIQICSPHRGHRKSNYANCGNLL